MKSAYIFGSGGHARVIASILYRKYRNFFFIDFKETTDKIINEQQFFDNIGQYVKADFFIGVGSNIIRKKIFNKLLSYNITPANCIAENAFIAKDALIGNGVVICPGSVVGTKSVIGDNTIINTLSSVDHDCIIGHHSQITAGVTFGGTTIVGENCFFGIKSATVPNVSIGNNAIIMAGSMVYKDIPADVMAGGNPARVVKSL